MSAPRLIDLPDVLTVNDVVALLQISHRSYSRMVRHGVFVEPIANLPGVRYAKSTVEAWINRRPTTAPVLARRRA